MRSCVRCGKNNHEEKGITFFAVPSRTEHPDWHSSFVKQLGIAETDNDSVDEIYVCEKHFEPEDLIVEGDSVKLKENAFPTPNDSEIEVEYVKPHLVYLNGDDAQLVPDSDAGSPNLAPLVPLVEYSYGDDQDGCEYTIQENVETEMIEEDSGSEKAPSEDGGGGGGGGNGQKVINFVSSGNNEFIQPMMPFFLSDSSVFTILNDGHEIGARRQLQIENAEGKEASGNQAKGSRHVRPPRDETKLSAMDKQLCRNKSERLTENFTCDICESSYSCMNCLKSHYETMHVANSNISHYKCKFNVNFTKGLSCPVCDLIFDCRSDTMDHYVTHSVACDICFSGFDRQLYLTEHMMSVHYTYNPEAVYECELCKAVYQYPSVLNKHYQGYHKMILCYLCKQRFETVSQLQDHEKIHWKKMNVLPFACSKCDKAFPKISDIAVHIRQDHKKPENVYNSVIIMTKEDKEQLPRKKVKVKK